MNLKKISFVILLGVTFSILLPNYASAQETSNDSYRPPDAFETSAGPSPTPTGQSCNGYCQCNCTDPRCPMTWDYYPSNSAITVQQCQQECVIAANQACSDQHSEPAPSATP